MHRSCSAAARRQAAQKIGIGLRGKRRDPELRLHARIPDRGDERDHVDIAARELLWVELPVADRRLPAVVGSRPDEPEVIRFGQRADDLIDGVVALVTPRAPDRLIGRGGHLRLRQPALGEDSAIGIEGHEVVAAMHRDEGFDVEQALAGRRVNRLVAFDRDARTGSGDREGQRRGASAPVRHDRPPDHGHGARHRGRRCRRRSGCIHAHELR